MPRTILFPQRKLARLSLLAMLLAGASPVLAQTVSIVQPGAPGQPVRVLSEAEAIALARNGHAPADAAFMQGMIVHHQQAVEMSALVADRTNNPVIVAVAGRITASQADEISMMQQWLTDRGEPIEMPAMGHAHHTGMEGMASAEQLARLRDARGTNFDRLFLELMIAHHQGAVTMVEDLLALYGTASDPTLYDFTTEVTNDQTAEIERMNAALASLSDDPRASLAAGFLDAGEAISNLRHVAFLQKPAGFFDPANPAGLLPELPAEEEAEAEAEAEVEADAHAGHTDHAAHMAAADPAPADPAEPVEPAEPRFAERSGLLDFANTDLAFAGDVLVAGNYHGFNAYRLGDDGVPQLLSSVVCPGGQGDVSIVGNLLLMSVEETRGRVDCGREGVTQRVSEERFRGLRIFDISDITRPVQVGQVQTCRGSHTHSVAAQTATSLVVYNSGTSRVREGEELAGCVGDEPGDDRTALFRIDVIEIPLANPAAARITSSPAVFADPATGRLAGLWQGGDHGDGTQDTDATDQCHDITVFPSLKIAAGACSGNGILFEIGRAHV